MVALYFMYYNFARVHQTLRVTPAMEADIADRVWSIERSAWGVEMLNYLKRIAAAAKATCLKVARFGLVP